MEGVDRQRTLFTAWDLVRLRLTAVTRAPNRPQDASFPPVTLTGPTPPRCSVKKQKKHHECDASFVLAEMEGVEPSRELPRLKL